MIVNVTICDEFSFKKIKTFTMTLNLSLIKSSTFLAHLLMLSRKISFLKRNFALRLRRNGKHLLKWEEMGNIYQNGERWEAFSKMGSIYEKEKK